MIGLTQGSKSLRIQIAIVALIAFFTLPWLFTDLRIVQPRLQTAEQGSEIVPLRFKLTGSSKRTIELFATTNPPLQWQRDMKIEIRIGLDNEMQKCFNAVVKPVLNSRLGNTRFSCIIPNSFSVDRVQGAQLAVSIVKQNSPIFLFSGEIDRKNSLLTVTDHPFLGDAARSVND